MYAQKYKLKLLALIAVTVFMPAGAAACDIPEKSANAIKNVNTANSSSQQQTSSEKQAATRLEKWKLNLEKKIKEYFGDDLSNVGMIYYDIERKQTIAMNEENLFLAASTSKVQMNMLAYQAVENKKLALNQSIRYQTEDYETGTGRLLSDYETSDAIPLSTLLDYSIKYSDNIAKNMVMRTLGGPVNVRTMTNKMVDTTTDTSGNWITPEEEFKVLLKLYQNRENPYYAHLIEVMKNTIFHDRIDKYIPQAIVAHKIGDYGVYVNDVGIVFTQKPYILVVYTKNLPGLASKQPSEKIAGLSKLIYEAHLAK